MHPGVREQVAEVRICLSLRSTTAPGHCCRQDSQVSKSKKGYVFRKHVVYIKEGKLRVPQSVSSELGVLPCSLLAGGGGGGGWKSDWQGTRLLGSKALSQPRKTPPGLSPSSPALAEPFQVLAE